MIHLVTMQFVKYFCLNLLIYCNCLVVLFLSHSISPCSFVSLSRCCILACRILFFVRRWIWIGRIIPSLLCVQWLMADYCITLYNDPSTGVCAAVFRGTVGNFTSPVVEFENNVSSICEFLFLLLHSCCVDGAGMNPLVNAATTIIVISPLNG